MSRANQNDKFVRVIQCFFDDTLMAEVKRLKAANKDQKIELIVFCCHSNLLTVKSAESISCALLVLTIH